MSKFKKEWLYKKILINRVYLMAPWPGIEPGTLPLTAGCSTG